MGKITIVGLGPGSSELITLETMTTLKMAEQLFLRTEKHPTVAALAEQGIQFQSYDYLYDQSATFDEVYEAIAEDVVKRAQAGMQIVYAVPGSPLVAEATVPMIRAKAAAANISLSVLPGMSFLELLYCRLGIDPIAGITILDAVDISNLPPDISTGLILTQVYNRHVASDAKLALMAFLPDDYPVVAVQRLGLADEKITSVPLFELDRISGIDHLTSVYIPAWQPAARSFTLEPVIEVMAKLRSPGGCLWDIEQDHRSLRRYIVEEVYEVLEAIDLADPEKLCEELGDLLLQIVFHARIAEESGTFSMQDVVDTVTEKLIRRHPHVFGDISVRDAAEVIFNWDKIKQTEKGYDRKSVLDGVPPALPGLMRAYKLQSKAAKVGFDWDAIEPVWNKITEEINEVREALAAEDNNLLENEVGDLLFSVVNLARFVGVEPETALNRTNKKFIDRFTYVEEQVRSQGRDWNNFTLEELDGFWNQAKRLED
ncbi:MAG: MazG family protein [Firmicutes bacterium]|nr:MazG family protein [Bacillota bacterium]